METKQLSDTFALVKKVKTTMKELDQYTGTVPMQLIEQANKDGYAISGPQFWNYYGMDGNADSAFWLEICVPVEEKEGGNSDNAQWVKGFQCVTTEHVGPWANLKGTYESLLANMAKENLTMGDYCREVYHKVDFENQENCITEIQMSVN